jgi:osmotically-inducible protein OsmY
MPRTVLLILVFLPALVMAQSSQPTDSSANQANAQPQSAPANPQDKADANQRIQSSIDDLLTGDPALDGVDVNVAVDDQNITLTGHVDSYAQHQRVLQLVSSYGRWRKIVDKVQMK